ncbi:MAG: carbohydrate ABC transporter substrate-binding protein [Treponema sp.]|nr:carbohydrate ABC transporter substrate-binding protein [Treponema sp.]
MKKVLSGVLALMVAGSFAFAGGGKDSASSASDDGKVLNIAVWNEEFQARFKDYFEKAGLVPDGVKVNWLMTPNLENAYQNKLDELLLNQKNAPADQKIDIFLVEADYALKYVDTPYTLDVKKEIGLTDADLASQYKYTKDIMTDSKGILKGVSWQACPGGFIYRRSIAKAVLGTDDPAKVQKALDNWDLFDEVAVKAKKQGYFMLSGYDDAFRVFSDNIKTPFVKGNKIQIDPNMNRWIDQTKTYTENGYNNKANLWSAESFKGAAKNGKVFGYFGPAWFIDFCLAPATLDDSNGPKQLGNGSYGDWAFCKGPQGFSWGGTWICAASGTDNKKLVHDVMYKLTCDKDTMIKIAEEMGDFTNNEEAMKVVANSSYKNPFLGGQNHVALFLDSAKSIDKSNTSAYDQGISENLQKAFADYFNGTVDRDTAWNNFYTSVIELYPNLKK